ncbi:polyamine ABC transporter substrate-binding protein [Paraburkholderia nemoris]|uniref:polyamine ABC transporter substrate-binding protein n=1 Tax=Paraburkholderia nemoris TaxID=2793076 RepID=UPI0038BCE7C7
MNNPTNPSRRKFAAQMAAAAAVIAAPAVISQRAFAADKTITVTSWGGDYHKMVQDIFATPFTQATGIKVVLVDNGDMAKVKAQVLSNSVQWDVVDAPAAFATSGSKEKLWEPLDVSLLQTGGLLQKASQDYMPMYLYSGGILWDPKRFTDGKHPVDFAGFFNVKQFPGRRCLRNLAPETLEAALIADGVAPKDLYPLDVNRAFAVLDRLKPHVTRWAASTPEQVGSVAQNEADFSYSYYNRVHSLQMSGVSLDFSLAQTCNSFDFFAIPKGSKNKEAAMQFITFCLRQDRQTAWAKAGFYMPNNLASQKEIKGSAGSKFLPDLDSGKNVIVNAQWWGDNYTAVQKRYAEWMIS